MDFDVDRKRAARKNKIYGIVAIFLVVGFFVGTFFLAGKPMMQFFSEPEKFRAWVDEKGIWSRVIFVGLMFFQVVAAAIPGEPLELAAGYAFGALEGTLL